MEIRTLGKNVSRLLIKGCFDGAPRRHLFLKPLMAQCAIKGIFISLLFPSLALAHEQWLLTPTQIKQLNKESTPTLFHYIQSFNLTVLAITLLVLLLWMLIHTFISHSPNLTPQRIQWSSLFLRLGSGSMLILCSLGLVPRAEVPYLVEPSLFAPDLVLNLPYPWTLLIWVEFSIGVLLILGLLTRTVSLLLALLLFFTIYLFGKPVLQYIGFYLGTCIFLFFQGGGKFSFSFEKKFSEKSAHLSLLSLQLFTGLNFLYSAISIKFLHPNLDVAILTAKKAFTFGLAYDQFAFLMLIVELSFGFLICLGWGLRLLSFLLICLFTFLTINFAENLLAHCFIYGILLSFIITGGVPLFKK